LKKAIQYCRVSSEGQVENTSIQDQQEKIKNYSKTYDIEIVAQFSDISSGGNTEREGYQNLKEYIKENKIDCIIVYKLDRLHRSLKNLLQDKEEFEEQGISIISVIEQMDTSTAQGKLFFNIIGSF
jgi:site-specific DNA recombinase